MTRSEALAALRALGSEAVKARFRRQGVPDDAMIGVKLGDVRALAKSIGRNHDLALDLWSTGVLEARLLAILLLAPKKLSHSELDTMVREADVTQVADWLDAYVLRKHPDAEALRRAWSADAHPWAARAAWRLTARRVANAPTGLDIDALLDVIDANLADAPDPARWTMNTCLATIGIHHPAHRSRAVAIGESVGAYRDYPTPKGCTSPFAPTWIAEMVRRQA